MGFEMVIADKVASRRGPCPGNHHWLLEQRPRPGLRDVEGVCRKCGARKMFPCLDWNDVLPDNFKKYLKAGHGIVPIIMNDEPQEPGLELFGWVNHKKRW